ncbi:alpha/beta-hydrolase [Punctularia strigosozonata HHB-11173 SS5]|uniref:alpha/beta-hydrolase n=1 Tax=Punctularia strigosozonata (strain HHB-11173) TaxID=741275 RepID=UPI00044178C4|nr:alpha/beta-hydrolase [Punctularia strigosozonata HHB-11173 SS5]EIN12743.1 alpha/beta-hydrolase [Punctularia strigosozonata HHB-11173 SS5]
MLDSVRVVTSSDGTKICTYSAGDPSRPAVVLIPGFCCTALAFEKQLRDPELTAHLYLIAYDPRGHGRSGAPSDEAAYVSQRHAEDFKAIHDAYGLEKPVVFGWSLGAIVPADIVKYYGADIIAGVIVAAGLPYISMHPEVVHPVIVNTVAPYILSEEVDSFSKGCVAFVESCFADPERDLPYDTKLAWMGAIAGMNPVARRYLITRTQDETALLAASDKLPYLVLHGDKDQHLIWEKVQQSMKARFNKSEFVLMRGAGHALFYERPEEVNKAILEFVSKF